MEFQDFNEIISSFKEPYKLNKYSKKEITILNKFIEELNNKIDLLNDILEKENNHWQSSYSIDRFKKIVNNYTNYNLGKKHKFGIGNIIAITNGDPYLHLELIIKTVISGCRIMIISNPTLVNFNLYITQIIRDILEKEKLDRDLISFVNIMDYRSKIIENQNVIDCIIINKDYDEYNYFVNNLVCKTIFLDYGNINIYTDSEEYESIIENIVKETYSVNISTYKYRINDLKSFASNENNNFIFNTAVIFSNDVNKCMDLYEIIKARNIFINTFDINKIDIGLDINDLLFEKKIVIEDRVLRSN